MTLETVVLRNSVSENRHGNAHLFQGWCQVVEVALHTRAGGERGGGREGEIGVLFDLIQGLLTRVRIM